MVSRRTLQFPSTDRASEFGANGDAAVTRSTLPHLHECDEVSPPLEPPFWRLTAAHPSQIHSTSRICEPTKSCQNLRQLPRPDQVSWIVICPLSGWSALRIAASSLAE